jgi:hypothetical protein
LSETGLFKEKEIKLFLQGKIEKEKKKALKIQAKLSPF